MFRPDHRASLSGAAVAEPQSGLRACYEYNLCQFQAELTWFYQMTPPHYNEPAHDSLQCAMDASVDGPA